MTLAEALNLLANVAIYEQYNLASPTFSDAGDGKVRVRFSPARADHMAWGYHTFDTMQELTVYTAGMHAARGEAAYDAKQAEQQAAQAPTE